MTISNREFSKHAVERYAERYPRLNFSEAISQVERIPKRDKKYRNIERRSKCRIYRSWLGPVFVVVNNTVVTVY